MKNEEMRTVNFNIGYDPYYVGRSIKQEGWICPKCGSVMSPYQPYCIFCNIGGSEPTCGGT